MVHYGALDSLLLSTESQMRLGGATFERIRGTLLGTMLRFANDAGVTPWTLLPQLQRFWNRAFDGGGLQVVKVGPKEALGCCVQTEMSNSPYFRNALRGLLSAVMGLFCRKAYVQELRAPRERGRWGSRCSGRDAGGVAGAGPALAVRYHRVVRRFERLQPAIAPSVRASTLSRRSRWSW